jgi:hypothetical protein
MESPADTCAVAAAIVGLTEKLIPDIDALADILSSNGFDRQHIGSSTAICSALGPPWIARHRCRLPKTWKAIQAASESRTAFAVRRIRLAAATLVATGHPLEPWRLHQAARLRPEVLSISAVEDERQHRLRLSQEIVGHFKLGKSLQASPLVTAADPEVGMAGFTAEVTDNGLRSFCGWRFMSGRAN